MKTKVLVFVSLACCLLLTGCPDLFTTTTTTTTTSSTTTTSTTTTSTTTSTTTTTTVLEPLVAIGDGAEVSLARFNGTSIYSLVTATPDDKPESNYAPNNVDHPAATYEYEITSAEPAILGRYTSQNLARNTAAEIRNPIQGQAGMDLIMRADGQRLLKNKAKRPPARISQSKDIAPPIVVGTLWDDVYVMDFAADTQVQISTECGYVSDHAFFFVDTRDLTSIDEYLAGYGTAFDTIYDICRDKFSAEADVDGNGKVIVIISQEITGGVLGYFSPTDKFAEGTYIRHSNEGDIFYVTGDISAHGPEGEVAATLAHEFQHMIYFDTLERLGVENSYDWLDEALSQASEYYTGYIEGEHEGWIRSFLVSFGKDYNPTLKTARYGLSLTHWSSRNYGYGAIFMHYLIDQFGDEAIKTFYTSGEIGITAVETATDMDFNDLFIDFSCALVMSGTGDSTDPRYEFTSLDLPAIQPLGRKGLLPFDGAYDGIIDLNVQDPEDYWYSYEIYPYSIEFDVWGGTFGTLKLEGIDVLTGPYVTGTAFGLSR